MAIFSLFSFLIMLMLGIFPIVVVVLIVMAIVKKNKEENRSDWFLKIVKTIYFYLILVVFLCMMIGSVVYATHSIGNYLMPNKQNNCYYDKYSDIDKEQKEMEKKCSEVKLQNEKNQSFVNIMTSLSMFIISLPIFLYHSKIAKDLDKR